MFERKCPKCNKKLFYTRIDHHKLATQKNSLCGSCAKIGNNHPMYGKKHSKKTRNRMSKSMMGDKNPSKRVEVKEKIRNTLVGRYCGNKNPNWRDRRTIKKWKRYIMDVWNVTRNQPLHTLENFDKRGYKQYHIDHKISIYEGFKRNISVKKIGNIKNLQMLWWKDNIKKNRNSI